MKNRLIKVSPIFGNEEKYFRKQTDLCQAMEWDIWQFRNHKNRQDNKEQFVYKEHKIETIIIQ